MTLLSKAATLVCLALLAGVATPQEKAVRPDLPIEEWLRGPERREIKSRVEFVSPRLTFQQRHLIEARGSVDVAPLQDGRPHDLYFILKVADERGRWFPDETFTHYAVQQGMDKKSEIQYDTGVYAKPGRYIVAVMLYDAASGRGSLWRKNVEVKPPKNDPLPELDRNLPRVEFVEEVPEDVQMQRTWRVGRREFTSSQRWRGTDQWPPGSGTEFLPIHNGRPMRLDIVLNFSPWIDPTLYRTTPVVAYRIVAGRILQLGALLSHLHPDRGCVSVTGMDLGRMETIFHRTQAGDADWTRIAGEVRKIDRNTVSVNVLGSKSSAAFLRDSIHTVLSDTSACGASNAERVVVLVSQGYEFPSGTRGDRLEGCDCRFFHIRIDTSPGDDLDGFLKPVQPRRFDVLTPMDFRKALARMIEELGGK